VVGDHKSAENMGASRPVEAADGLRKFPSPLFSNRPCLDIVKDNFGTFPLELRKVSRTEQTLFSRE